MPKDGARATTLRWPTLAIIMPALDEEAAVGAQVRALRAHTAFQALPLAHMRVIVVDNGSRDHTAEVARAAGAEVVREPRRGYGYACQAGVCAAAGADVVLLMDADGSDDLDGASRVARLVLAGKADLAMGARRLEQHTLNVRRGARSRLGALTPQQRAGNAVGALALRLLYGARVSDIAPVRAMRREALLALDPHEMAYGWSTEMLAKSARAGLRIVELPVIAHPRAGGRSKVAGTLRGTLGASIHILRTLWRYRAWQPRAGPPRDGQPKGPAHESVAPGGPAIETAPGWPTAAKSASADWEQSRWRDGAGRDASSNACPLALFVVARLPVAGQAKTRLGRAIGHQAAAALYRAFLRDLSMRLRDLSMRLSAAALTDGFDLYWYYAAPANADEAEFAACVAAEDKASLAASATTRGYIARLSSALPSPPPSLAPLLSPLPAGRGVGGEDPPRVRFLRQPEGDFAARLWQGFQWLAARGYERIVVLGSDSPQVPAGQIAAAFAALETHDLALGPARDGGYYLLGQRGQPADLFSGIEMSTPSVAAETLERAAALGLSVAALPESFDVDEPADLDMLAAALAHAPSADADPAPATLAALTALAHVVRPSALLSEVAQPEMTAHAGTSTPTPAEREVEGAAHGAA